jgi:hypothetical protein
LESSFVQGHIKAIESLLSALSLGAARADCHFRLRISSTNCAHFLAAIHTSSFLEFREEPFEYQSLLICSSAADLRD